MGSETSTVASLGPVRCDLLGTINFCVQFSNISCQNRNNTVKKAIAYVLVDNLVLQLSLQRVNIIKNNVIRFPNAPFCIMWLALRDSRYISSMLQPALFPMSHGTDMSFCSSNVIKIGTHQLSFTVNQNFERNLQAISNIHWRFLEVHDQLCSLKDRLPDSNILDTGNVKNQFTK